MDTGHVGCPIRAYGNRTIPCRNRLIPFSGNGIPEHRVGRLHSATQRNVVFRLFRVSENRCASVYPNGERKSGLCKSASAIRARSSRGNETISSIKSSVFIGRSLLIIESVLHFLTLPRSYWADHDHCVDPVFGSPKFA